MSDLINNQKIAELSDVQKYAVWNYNNNNNYNLNLNNYKSNHITTDCTWLYFIKKILPSACQIQARINDITKLMAITNNSFTDSNLSLFKWSNNFSWYYHNGLNLEIRKRIQSLGGNPDYSKIRCSIMYDTSDEIDLHCITPNDNHLFYCRKEIDNGVLDVDSKPPCKPIKSICFNSNAQEGTYEFYLHSYKHAPNSIALITIELEVNDVIYTSKEVLTFENQKKVIFQFDYSKNNKKVRFLSEVNDITPNLSKEEFKHIWNLDLDLDNNNSFVNVSCILNSPNLWDLTDTQESHSPTNNNNTSTNIIINKSNPNLHTTQYHQLKDASYFKDYKKYFNNSMDYTSNYIHYDRSSELDSQENTNRFNQHHVFFLLQSCIDLSQIKNKTLPLEHINSNINPNSVINKSITDINLTNNNFACGIGYIKEQLWNLNLKVLHDNNIIKSYNITKYF